MRVVLDTNVFIAAGFNRRSHSAQIIEGARDGTFEMVWHESTKHETRRMLDRIPRLSWQTFEGLFKAENEIIDALDLNRYAFVSDIDDRKFAALAELANCTLVTNDDDLLSNQGRLSVPVLTPRDLVEARLEAHSRAPGSS